MWVADADWATACDPGHDVGGGAQPRAALTIEKACANQEQVDRLATSFLQPGAGNDIYDWGTGIFGAPWGPHGFSFLIPPRRPMRFTSWCSTSTATVSRHRDKALPAAAQSRRYPGPNLQRTADVLSRRAVPYVLDGGCHRHPGARVPAHDPVLPETSSAGRHERKMAERDGLGSGRGPGCRQDGDRRSALGSLRRPHGRRTGAVGYRCSTSTTTCRSPGGTSCSRTIPSTTRLART